MGRGNYQDDEIERLRDILACVHAKQPKRGIGELVRKIFGRFTKSPQKVSVQSAEKKRQKQKRDAA